MWNFPNVTAVIMVKVLTYLNKSDSLIILYK